MEREGRLLQQELLRSDLGQLRQDRRSLRQYGGRLRCLRSQPQEILV